MLIIFIGFCSLASDIVSIFFYIQIFLAILGSISLLVFLLFFMITQKLLKSSEIISSETFTSLFSNMLFFIQSVILSAQVNRRGDKSSHFVELIF